ncbi:MAG: right-handed parallel beta-helix repeat-containing protein, partial [Thermoplasmatales archaeon]|nr:right-handed parallel beta-helix repeat-containing protein [Thermoplasmatales archaeon]
GEMYILNSSNITSVNPNAHYLFWVRNDSKFEMRDSELSECGWNVDNKGLEIETDSVLIENCMFSDNYIGLYLSYSSNNTIINCTIYDNSRDGIYLYSSSNNIITNCLIHNNSWYGIYLLDSSDNQISACWIYNNSYSGLWHYGSSNNSISACHIYNNSDYGVCLSSSSNSAVSECRIYNNSYGIRLWSSSNNNQITNCTIYNNSDGIKLLYSSNNTISNCTISSNNETGIYLEDSSNNEITDCNISDNNVGIYLLDSVNTSVKDCNFSNNTYGTVVDSSSETTLAGCDYIFNGDIIPPGKKKGLTAHVTALYPSAINCYNSSDTEISDCAISENKKGVCLQNSSNINISNCTISSNNETGVYLVSSSDTLIANSTISGNYSNPDYHDLFLSSDSHLNLLNTKFTNVSFADTNSTLNVSWYLDVNVLWNNSIPAEYADVTIFDNLTNEVFNGSTDKNGWIKNIVVQEYTQNQTNTTSFTPHNVTASQGYISVWDDNVTVDETKTVWLILDHNAPEINYTTVSPEQEYSTDENTTLDFSFNVSHPDNLTLIYYWYLYLNETEVENATGALENTTVIQKINWTYYFNFTSHGNYTVKVTVSDGNATVSCEWVLTVNDVNGRPEITCFYPPKDIVLGNLSCIIFSITASDPDNDAISYQWEVNGREVNETSEYIFYAEYNASENATNVYYVEVTVTDGKLPDNHTWTVTVVDLNATYDYLLQQIEILKAAVENITKLIGNITETLLNRTELLENITWLVENITALNMTVLKDKLDQLFIELENMNVTLAQLNENLTRIQEELNNATDKIGNLTVMLESANASRDQAIDNEIMAQNAKEIAENAAAAALKEKDEAIKAKNKAEYKLAGSVVLGVIGGVIAGFLISFLLRRKLPKKG